MKPFLENNRELWDQWTRLHLETNSDYQQELARFRAGEVILSEIELQEVGEVSGKLMLHLMCHFGLASLSWARKGAWVTGVDFSEEAIRQARSLNAESGLDVEFICSDIYCLPDVLDRKFDLVYTSTGVLAWLPDLERWAKLAAGFLNPGGVFYLHDGHPFRRVMFPIVQDGFGEIAQYDYFALEPIRLDMRGSYAQPDDPTIHPAYFWVHGIGEIVTAICAAGLKIEYLHEFPKVYADFPAYIQPSPGQFQMHVIHDWAVPNTFSLRATL